MVSPLNSIAANLRPAPSGASMIGDILMKGRQGEAALQGQQLQNQIQQERLNQMQAPPQMSAEQSLGAARYLNSLGKQLLSTDESQWDQLLQSNLPQLQQLGYNPQQLQGLTRDQIESVVAQTDPLMEVAEPEDTQGRVDKLRSRYDSFTKDLRQVDAAFRKVNKAPETASGDMSLIFGFMKLLDPGSTVREGEFASAEEATGVPTRILNAYNRALRGERLSPEQREDFKATAKQTFDAQQESADSQIATLLQQADQDGVSRARVLGAENLRSFEKRAADRLISQAGQEDPANTEPVITNHPTLGDITEDDIEETMRANNMTREEVLARLQGG